ncbi:AraC family transcriptional regulator [Aliivibrio sp. S3MY1]|uniref:helix-turn-helix transcriptional regulator n=1 Tax=unclassified Aliivibrio TaxID=2645654 RepID=UPI002379BD95|nr:MULTISPECIES: AraC family transcriptional regulator [unclassified Aliivibrio]MDD9195122.1 AraC family transcriptional regulator [Aliivibrio sp. S3MY1]MDD9198412.1 AraC family transcriptional regulator [Aliivibrio sp. S2MY1]
MDKVMLNEPIFRVQTYSGKSDQHLRNVHIYAPSIIWVKSGVKTVFQESEQFDVDAHSWLLTSANQGLNFINKTTKDNFYSVQICFFLAPPKEMLEESQSNESTRLHTHAVTVSPLLAYGFTFLTDTNTQKLSSKTQQFHLLALYQQLAELGVLHVLFSPSFASFQNELSAYFSKNPAEPYQLETVCDDFSMSRATLIRRLQRDGTNFRTVLSNVRMSHALGLMQEKKQSQLDLALQCGYQSESRFSQRFHQQFGMTPKQYMKTVVY